MTADGGRGKGIRNTFNDRLVAFLDRHQTVHLTQPERLAILVLEIGEILEIGFRGQIKIDVDGGRINAVTPEPQKIGI